MLYLSESTASDNPVSEDAFKDSLLKFPFFFVFFFLNTQRPKSSVATHTGMQRAEAKVRTEEKQKKRER